jgi:hypothetical protein
VGEASDPVVFVPAPAPEDASEGGAFVMTLVTSVFFNAARPPVHAPIAEPAVVAAADPVPVLVAAAVVAVAPVADVAVAVDDAPPLG